MRLFVLSLLCSTAAQAGPLETWGGGEIGLAGNVGVATHGAHAAWYNPAMIHAQRFDAAGEYVYGNGSFDLAGKAAKGVPDPEVSSTRGALIGAELNSYWMGLKRMNLGAALFLPTSGPFSWHEAPIAAGDEPPIPIAPRWTSDLSRLDAALGASYLLHDRVSIGLGVDISASFVTLTFIEVEDFETAEDSPRGQDVVIRPTFHPTAGASVLVGDPEGARARIGVVGRTGRSMDDSGTSSVTLLGGDFTFRHHYVRYYAPPMVTLGTDVQPIDALSVRVEGGYEAWSNAVGPIAEDLAADWVDIVTARAGVRVAVGPLKVLGGYGYDPGPARSSPRNTLYVDAASHALDAGFGAVVYTSEEGDETQADRELEVLIGLQSRTFVSTTIDTRPSGQVDLSGDLLGFRAGLVWGH